MSKKSSKRPGKTDNNLPRTNNSSIQNGKQNEQNIREFWYHQGPVPDPQTLKGYQDLIPDAPERFLEMAEEEAAYRRRLDFAKIDLEASQVKRGQNYALISVLAVLGLCGFAIHKDAEWVATVLGGISLAGIIYAFTAGRRPDSKKGPS